MNVKHISYTKSVCFLRIRRTLHGFLSHVPLKNQRNWSIKLKNIYAEVTETREDEIQDHLELKADRVKPIILLVLNLSYCKQKEFA